MPITPISAKTLTALPGFKLLDGLKSWQLVRNRTENMKKVREKSQLRRKIWAWYDRFAPGEREHPRGRKEWKPCPKTSERV